VGRLLGGLLVVVLAAAGIAAVVLLLQSRDDAGVSGTAGPGERVADRCPPRRAPVTRDRRRLSRAQVQTALAAGNVVIFYGGPRPPGALVTLQRDLTGPFDAEIAAAGQAVVLGRGPASGYEARAWGRRLTAASPRAGRLREFAEAWLGEGAPEPCDGPS
jgi:hypothetical protein